MHGIAARGAPLHRACAATLSGTAPSLAHLRQSFSSASSTPPTPVDYYKVLGLTPSASLDDIKRTFREQAKKHHPDLAKGPSEADSLAAFKLVNEAYSVLSDASESGRMCCALAIPSYVFFCAAHASAPMLFFAGLLKSWIVSGAHSQLLSSLLHTIPFPPCV
jgi:hypothetical protein